TLGGFILFLTGFFGGATSSVVPPLALIFSPADFEKWLAFTVNFFVTSPVPRTRTPSAGPLARPIFSRASASTVSPSLKALSMSPTLTTWYFLSQVSWEKPRLGMRRKRGICPPSKVKAGFLAPALAYWPLLPRDDVLPCPEPGP